MTTKTIIDLTFLVTTADGDKVDLEPGDWIELSDPSYGVYDRGEILSTEVGHAAVAWQGAACVTASTEQSLSGRVYVYAGKPTKWAHEWPSDDDT